MLAIEASDDDQLYMTNCLCNPNQGVNNMGMLLWHKHNQPCNMYHEGIVWLDIVGSPKQLNYSGAHVCLATSI